MKYRIIRQSKDVKLKIVGKDQTELFLHAAFALFDLLDPRKRYPRKDLGPYRIVRITSLDNESLLIDWLNQLLSLHKDLKENYFDIEVIELTNTNLEVRMKGIPAPPAAMELSQATSHEILLEPTEDGLVANVVFEK